jgi:hypothetical protein
MTQAQHLVLRFGFLLLFDAQQNNPLQHQYPQCNFDDTPIIKGLNKLDVHGPLGFEALYAVASGPW